MRMTQEKSVYQLTFIPRLFPVNCYLVEEEQGLTLIDAAIPNCARQILNAAHTIGKPITRIVLTHAHGDHVGSLDAVKQVLKDVPVYISRRDARLMTGDRSLDKEEPNSPIRGGVPKNLRTQADFLLEEGDQIGSLMAIAAPGHTPGSMAFLDARNRSLIAGDAFQTRGGIAVAGQIRPWFPFPAWGTWNAKKALESARKLQEYDPSLLAVGHGNMLTQPSSALHYAIMEAERNLERNVLK